MQIVEGLLVFLFLVVVALAAAALLLGPVAIVQRRRTARVEALNGGSTIWVVSDGRRTWYLVIAATTIAIVDKSNRGRSWPLSEIQSAALARLPSRTGALRTGGFTGTGLAIKVGDGPDDVLRVLFPWPGSVGASKTKAMTALALIQSARDTGATSAS